MTATSLRTRNFGWQDPLGAAGLSCFSDTGQKLWDFRPPEGFDYISDCYALNVCRNGVWAYYSFMPSLTTPSFCSLPSGVNKEAWFFSTRKRIASPISIFFFPPHSLDE